MITIQINKTKFKIPQGRHEVSYDQWKNAYAGIKKAEEAKQAYEDGDNEQATILTIEHMADIISKLSIGVTTKEILQAPFDQITNLFITKFDWIWNEEAKAKFKIKGKYFDIPNFGRMSGMQLMDCMQLIQQMEGDDEIDKGLIIASIYTQEKYEQDFENLEAKKQFLKDNAKLDLFFACAFFLRSGIQNLKGYTLPASIGAEVESLTSTLNDWVCILYLQVLQKREYSPIQWKREQFSNIRLGSQSKIYSYLRNIKLQSKKIILKIKNKLLYLKP